MPNIAYWEYEENFKGFIIIQVPIIIARIKIYVLGCSFSLRKIEEKITTKTPDN